MDSLDMVKALICSDCTAKYKCSEHIVPLRNIEDICPDCTTTCRCSGHEWLGIILPDRDKDKTCAICLESHEEDMFATRLRCGHLFHYNCIHKWLDIKRNCPICWKIEPILPPMKSFMLPNDLKIMPE